MKKTMLLLCLAALIVPASAQHFKQAGGPQNAVFVVWTNAGTDG